MRSAQCDAPGQGATQRTHDIDVRRHAIAGIAGTHGFEVGQRRQLGLVAEFGDEDDAETIIEKYEFKQLKNSLKVTW